MPDLNIFRIDAGETHDLRHRILRPHQTLGEMAYPGDDAADTIHLGASNPAWTHSAEWLGIASLYTEPMPRDPKPTDRRLRGMAVSHPHQRGGVGSALVGAVISVARQAGAARVWCNARTSACGFYERNGFARLGEPFDLPGIGEHYVMWIAVGPDHR